VFSPGITAETDRGSFTLELVSATPDPPDVGDNDWVIAISDGSQMLQGASVILEPWMPAHGHGLNPPTYIATPGSSPGEYVIPTFDLIMPGVWEFRINVNRVMVSDNAVFTFCAEG
ncbi:MAG: FixH family protein, partial [Myxococcales bacterium]|nr:FixH family protein [Myxococcales bacterium]